MVKPKTVYYVETVKKRVDPGYGVRAGGLYSVLQHAATRARTLRRAGANVQVFEADVVWREVAEHRVEPMED